MKYMLLAMVVCAIACNTKDQDTDLIIGRWKIYSTTLRGLTVTRNDMKAGIDENFRVEKLRVINKKQSFTPEDSVSAMQRSIQSLHALMQMEYDIQPNNKLNILVPGIATTKGTYKYRSNKLFLEFANNKRAEYRTRVIGDTLHLFLVLNGDEFVFTRAQ
jgi:hypothetical protein